MENKLKYATMKFGEAIIPQYVEKISRGGWVNYGDDNLYPDYLISLMNRSSKHNAILKTKSQIIAGNGFEKEGLDPKAISILSNPYNELNLDQIVYRSGYDQEVFGAFSLLITYSRGGSQIAEVGYLPNNKIRLDDAGEFVYYSNDWSNVRKNTPVKYPVFNPKKPGGVQIMYIKEYRPGCEYYGQPGYLPSINWIDLEYQISLFHHSQVKGGFMPKMIISMNSGIPSEEEMGDIVRQLKRDFEGADGQDVMFLFADGKESSAEITSFQLNDSDQRFIQLNKEVTEGILVGHSVTNPALLGVSQDGALGMKNVILESLEMFQALYVNPKQIILEDAFNQILKFNGSTSKLKLIKYQLDINKITE